MMVNTYPEHGQIVILNGAPRSGKSSIANVIQELFEGVWIGLGVDLIMQSTPARFLPGIGLRPGGERPDLEPIVCLQYQALYESIAAHSRLGFNVVVDVGHHDSYSVPLGILQRCARILDEYPVLFIGIHCPIETIVERRRLTGWKELDASSSSPIVRWQNEVHKPGIYDLQLDTSLHTSTECAEIIRNFIDSGVSSFAFQRLAETDA